MPRKQPSRSITLFDDSRGQAYTIEAIFAVLLMMSGVLFALQATAITPLTSSTSNERIELQEKNIAKSLLESAAEQETLVPTVTYWDTTTQTFIDSDGPTGYQNDAPPTEFGDQINNTFTDANIAVNVYIAYRTPNNNHQRVKRLMFQGTPSDNAVSASQTVVLLDDTKLNDGSGRTLKTVEDDYFIKDASPETNIYNIAEVRVVVWRM